MSETNSRGHKAKLELDDIEWPVVDLKISGDLTGIAREILGAFLDTLNLDFQTNLSQCYVKSKPEHTLYKNVIGISLSSFPSDDNDVFFTYEPIIARTLYSMIIERINDDHCPLVGDGEVADVFDRDGDVYAVANALEKLAYELRQRAKDAGANKL